MASMSLAQFAASLRAPKIVAMCGSDRAGSLNRKLLACAAGELAKQGAEVEVVDLPALDLPLCKKLKPCHSRVRPQPRRARLRFIGLTTCG